MPESLPLPIRILVKGASTVSWASGIDRSRDAFIFPRAIEAELLKEGRPAQVQTISVPSERTKSTLLNWEREVLGFSPDVIVLVYGHYETVHLFLPWWLERHANSRRARPRPLAELYRRTLLRPVWMFLAKLQARLDTRLDPTLRRNRPKYVAADLERLIERVQEIGSPLVYVFELLPPAKRYHTWFPGMAARIEVMNRTLADLVDRVNLPNVQYFKVSELVDKHCAGDIDVATPDGFHYTPELHYEIGAELARRISTWAETQPHLAIPEGADRDTRLAQ
jgi:hypothetical protein